MTSVLADSQLSFWLLQQINKNYFKISIAEIKLVMFRTAQVKVKLVKIAISRRRNLWITIFPYFLISLFPYLQSFLIFKYTNRW